MGGGGRVCFVLGFFVIILFWFFSQVCSSGGLSRPVTAVKTQRPISLSPGRSETAPESRAAVIALHLALVYSGVYAHIYTTQAEGNLSDKDSVIHFEKHLPPV